MKEMDCVEVVVEKEKYVKEGVHKGMQGWICYPECTNGYWLVNFPQCGGKEDIATADIKEEDLRLVPVMYAVVNERIKAKFENAENSVKESPETPDDLSGYMI